MAYITYKSIDCYMAYFFSKCQSAGKEEAPSITLWMGMIESNTIKIILKILPDRN